MKPNHKNAYDSLTQVITTMVANRLDRNTIDSLRQMIELDAFQPIRSVIEEKIIEIGNHLKEVDAKEALKVETPKTRIDDGIQNEETRKEIESFLNSPCFEYEIEIKDYFHNLDKIPPKVLV